MSTEKINKKNIKKGIMIIISSPSGAGKTTLCKKISSLDNNIFLSISYTTRKKRESEKDGGYGATSWSRVECGGTTFVARHGFANYIPAH